MYKPFKRGGNMYLLKTISEEVRLAQVSFKKYRKTKKLIVGSIFASMAAILQSAGGFLPGVGLFFSPLATAPILLCTMFSLSSGIISYFLTILLLMILQPTELMIFPFTTGLLAIGIGVSFSFLKKRVSIIVMGGCLLALGIMSLLYIFHFPVLGPAVSDSFSFLTTAIIFLFSFIYSWLWVEIALYIFKKTKDLLF